MMLVLVLGHRRGLTKALEKLQCPFVIWHSSSIKSKTKAVHLIEAPYPKTKEQVQERIKDLPPITHVISAIEETVFPASRVRYWLGAKRNPHAAIVNCSDKLKMKQFLVDKEIPMTDFVDPKAGLSPQELFERMGKPIIAKKRFSSGGRALERISEVSQLIKRMKRGQILEKSITGSEGSVESIIFDKEILFENITEYVSHGEINLLPANFSDELREGILNLNRKVIKALNIKWGMTHLEFYNTDQGILFGEIALRPPGGYIMDCIEMAYQFNPWEALLKTEIGEKPTLDNQHTNFAVSILFPRRPGIVKSITGADESSQLDSVQKVSITVKVGDELKAKDGISDVMGYALLQNENLDDLLKDLNQLKEHIKFDI